MRRQNMHSRRSPVKNLQGVRVGGLKRQEELIPPASNPVWETLYKLTILLQCRLSGEIVSVFRVR